MHKSEIIALTAWAIAYRDNPSILSRSPNQALAITVHEYMSHGEWRTSRAIATELKESIDSVRLVMAVIRDVWGYESSKSRNKGYRRKNNVN